MFKNSDTFSSFSTNDMQQAKEFYGDTLGFVVEEDKEMTILHINFANGGKVVIYPKDNHVPATYTVLNIIVENIDEAVDTLVAKGIKFEHYDGEYGTDEKGISRGEPKIAWFKDPSGNILSVIQEKK